MISGIRELDGRRLFQITAPISAGSSGGPVFNDRGEIIGVVVPSLETGQNLNFAIPINYAKSLLDSSSETPIVDLPRRRTTGDDARDKPSPQDSVDSTKTAAQTVRHIADAIRACGMESSVHSTAEASPRYFRVHSGPPTDVRFDVRPNNDDSFVYPSVGTVEFSVQFGVSEFAATSQGAAAATDWSPFSGTTQHRRVFNIDETGNLAELDHRETFGSNSYIQTTVVEIVSRGDLGNAAIEMGSHDNYQISWESEQGNSGARWEHEPKPQVK